MTWAIVTPHSAWLAQATTAWAALEPQAPQGSQLRDHATIDHATIDHATIDHANFALLIEALAALTPGQVSQELQNLAGLRPVGAVLGIPDRGDTDGDAAAV